MPRKVCLVSSAGGHFDQLIELLPALRGTECIFITDDENALRFRAAAPFVRTYLLAKSQRDLKVVPNLVRAYRILRKERPDTIISTGAGCAVPVFLVGKFVFGCKTLFIETFNAVTRPTLTGRVLYPIADRFVYQWKYLARHYPKGTYGGPCYDFRDGRKP